METEASQTPPAAEPPRGKGVHPVRRVIRTLRTIANLPLQLRLKWLLAGMGIFLVAVIMTQVQFNDLNQAKRDQLEVQSESRDYTLTLAQWSTDKVIFDACQVLYDQSVGNRAWKTWLLDKLDSLTPPDDEVANDFITEGREKLDELVPEFPVNDCVDPGPKPEPPEGFDPNVNDPTEEGEE